MWTHPHRDLILGIMDGGSYTAFTPYCGLIASITSLRTPTVTEVAYTGYGTRPSISLGAVANTSPAGGRQKANDALVSFPQNTGGDVSAIAWGIYDAATAGNLKEVNFLDADPPIACVANDTSTEDLIAPAHGLVADQRVFVLASPGMLLPAGLAEDTAYFVLATGLTADTLRLSTSSGGSAVNITAKGAAMLLPYTARTIAGGSTPEFAIGALVTQI